MGSVISFKNPETNIKLSINIDKGFIVVFGKNGSGKTTLSRNAPDKECVFNNDFIHGTVYVETSQGANDDSKTKESFSELWIGETIVKMKEELESIKNQKIICERKRQETINEINKVFNDAGISSIKYSDIDKNISNVYFKRDDYNDKTDEEIIDIYKSKIAYNTIIKNDEQLEQSITSFNNSELVKLFIKQIKENAFLDEVFLLGSDNETKSLLNSISRYNQIFREVKEIDSCYKSKNVREEEKWIELALKLHEEADSCYFCGNPNIKEAMEKWKSITTSKLKEESTQIINAIDKILKSIELILRGKDSYKKIATNSISTLEKLNEYFSKIKQLMISREEIDSEFNLPEINKDELIMEGNELLENIQNYIFGPFASKYESTFLLIKYYSLLQIAKEKEIEDEMKKSANEIKETINKHLRDLDFDKELKIAIEKRGAEKKFRFGFVNSSTKIGTLSDGQKHKLALAIFFASIEKMDLTNKIVVLDDPIVTLDYRSNYSIKSKIIKLRNEQSPKSVIVLTCNIDYLYIQLSNLFNKDDENDIKLIHLSNYVAEELDYNIINYDDLSLFQNCLKAVSNYEEYSLVASLNVRLYRMFLDLYLRMRGYPTTGNPKDEINSINVFTGDKKKTLLECNKFIQQYCRDTNATNLQLYETFIKLNDFVETLGFPPLINNDLINKLKKYANNDKRLHEYSGDSLLFLIVARAEQIMLSTNEKYKCLKDYMNHPRTQITNSIVGVDFSDLEAKSL